MQKEKSLGSEPSPSSLRDATSPERGRFCSAYRQMAKSSPFGGTGERSEPERVTLASSPSQSMPVGLDSSPKGRALGSPRKLHLFAKASPFGRGGCERSEQTERARTLAGHLLKFSLPCNDFHRSTVCSTEKVSKFCPAAKGRNKDRLPFLGGKVMRFADFDTTFAKDSPQRY